MLVLEHFRAPVGNIRFYNYLFQQQKLTFRIKRCLHCLSLLIGIHLTELRIWTSTTSLHNGDFQSSLVSSCLVMTSSLRELDRMNEVLTIQLKSDLKCRMSFFRSCACSFVWVPMSFLLFFYIYMFGPIQRVVDNFVMGLSSVFLNFHPFF